MFELVSRRYQSSSTLITTNRPFAEWSEVFPNAACVVSLVDRLVHNAEIIAIEGESYRLKEARERTEQRARQRRGAQVMSEPTTPPPAAEHAALGNARRHPHPWTPEQALAVFELLIDCAMPSPVSMHSRSRTCCAKLRPPASTISPPATTI